MVLGLCAQYLLQQHPSLMQVCAACANGLLEAHPLLLSQLTCGPLAPFSGPLLLLLLLLRRRRLLLLHMCVLCV